jgi:phytanoyl-CoA hydroxylase
MSQGTLNLEQARHYRNQGYLKVNGVFNDLETAELRTFVNLEATNEEPVAHNVGSAVLKMYDLYNRNHKLMHRTITNSRLVGVLQSLLGPNIVFVKNRHNHASVNDQIGEPIEGLHRDILQPTRGLVTAALYLDDSTIENGATMIIPGSHDLPYVGAPQVDGGGTWLRDHTEYDGMEEQALPVPVKEGGVLLFNGLTFHGISANMTGSPRRSITLGFRSVDELAYTPDAEREVLVSGEYLYRGNDRSTSS